MYLNILILKVKIEINRIIQSNLKDKKGQKITIVLKMY